MFCAACGERVGDARVCAGCGADLMMSGAIRLTDPASDVSASLRRRDEQRGVRDDLSVDGADADASEPDEADDISMDSAPRHASDSPDDDDEFDGSPARHKSRSAIVEQVRRGATGVRDWVGENVPEDVYRDTWDELSGNQHRRKLMVMFAGLLPVALIVSIVAALAILRTADRSIAPPASPAPTSVVETPTPTPTPTPSPTPTPTPTPTATPPRLPAESRQCGPGLGANEAASCEFAQAVFDKVDRAMTGSVDIQAYSPKTKRTYSMTCVRAEIITCASTGSAKVYILPS